MVVAIDYLALMAVVAAVDAVATPAVIAIWMALEKAVTSLSIILVFRASVLSSSLSSTLSLIPESCASWV